MAQFIIKKNPTVWWPVSVVIPADGGVTAYQFEAQIRVRPESELDAALEKERRAQEAAGTSLLLSLEAAAVSLPEFVADWRGVVDDEGFPIPFDYLKSVLLESGYGLAVSKALWTAVTEVRFGKAPEFEGATAKNLQPSPAPGRATEGVGTN